MKRMIDDKLVNEIVSKLTNGFSGDNASTKKIYYHPIYIYNYPEESMMLSCVIINNDPTPFTMATLKEFIESVNFSLCPVSGTIIVGDQTYDVHRIFSYKNGSKYIYGYNRTTPGIANAVDVTSIWDTLFSGTGIDDDVNPIN